MGITAVATALFVGLSRVHLRLHFVTDVLGGAALGAAGAAFGRLVVPGR